MPRMKKMAGRRRIWRAAYAECESMTTVSQRSIKLTTLASICFRRLGSPDVSDDLLSMTEEDLAALELHPATLQYATRTTTESRFWSPDNSRLSL